MALASLVALDPRLCALFGAVYTVPGWAMVLATRGARSRLGPGEDRSATQVVRLTNRTIASTSMYVVPLLLVLANLHVWSPWTGGQWDSPLDSTQRALLHMQLMYYLVDMPYTLLKKDVEQVVHHAIGLGLALPTVQLNKCGLVMCSVLFTEQGTSIWVRYIKMLRYFLPAYNPLERVLVALNFVQNTLFFFVVNTPLLLRIAHEVLYGTGIPVQGAGKYVLGYAVLLQLAYDAYWTRRLWSSFFKYRAKLRGGAKKKN